MQLYDRHGRDLDFISSINRDGKGITDVSKDDMSFLDDTAFKMTRLSISDNTFVAHSINTYTVKLKK